MCRRSHPHCASPLRSTRLASASRPVAPRRDDPDRGHRQSLLGGSRRPTRRTPSVCRCSQARRLPPPRSICRHGAVDCSTSGRRSGQSEAGRSRSGAKTDKGVPRYRHAEESDVYVLSGAEDLVPVLLADGTRFTDETSAPGYIVHRYRPRTEGLFARIERGLTGKPEQSRGAR